MPQKETEMRHYLIVLGSIFCLSLSPIIVRFAQSEGIPSILIAGSRMALASILITPIVFGYFRQEIQSLEPRYLLSLAFTGIWMSLNGILIIISLEHIPVLTNQILTSTAPVWVAIIEIVWLKTRFHSLIWFGILLVILGSLIISLPQFSADNSSTSFLGIGLALASAVCGAIYTALGRYSRAKVSIIPYLWIVYGVGGIFAFSIMGFTQVSIWGYSAKGYGWIVVSTLLIQLLGFSGMGFALAYFPATIVVMATRSVVILSVLLAFLIFMEIPTVFQIIGSVILLIGIISAILGQETTIKRLKA